MRRKFNMSIYKSKHNVGDVEFVECPYCEKSETNRFKMLHHKHLAGHNKTLEDVLKEFPGLVTMTLVEKNKKINATKLATEKFINNIQNGNTKESKCWYNDDQNCSHEIRIVEIYEPNHFLCKKCESLGKKSKDKRTFEETKEKRIVTFNERYGVDNAKQVHLKNK
jgi:hypothetical protein